MRGVAENGGGGGGGGPSCSVDLGKDEDNSRATCMQCYLSGHSDGSLDSVDPSTECSGSSGGELGTSTVSTVGGDTRQETGDRDSGIMEDTGTVVVLEETGRQASLP